MPEIGHQHEIVLVEVGKLPRHVGNVQHLRFEQRRPALPIDESGLDERALAERRHRDIRRRLPSEPFVKQSICFTKPDR